APAGPARLALGGAVLFSLAGGHDLDVSAAAARRGPLRRGGLVHAGLGGLPDAAPGRPAVLPQAAAVLLADGGIPGAVRRQCLGRAPVLGAGRHGAGDGLLRLPAPLRQRPCRGPHDPDPGGAALPVRRGALRQPGHAGGRPDGPDRDGGRRRGAPPRAVAARWLVAGGHVRRCGGRVPGQGPDRHRAAGRRAVLLAPGPAPVPRPGTPAVVAGHPAVPGTDPALDGDHAAAPSRLLRLLHRLPAFPALSRNRLQQSAPVLVLCAGGAGPDPAVVDPVVALVPAPGAAADGVRAARPPDRAGRPP